MARTLDDVTPRLPFTLLTLSFLITLCSLLWLSLHEIYSINELQNVIDAEVKIKTAKIKSPTATSAHINQAEKKIDLSLQRINATEALAFNFKSKDEESGATVFSHYQSYRKNHVTYFTITILISLLSLITAGLALLVHNHRLKKARQDQQRLEELLYYDQLSENKDLTPLNATLPKAFLQLQNNPLVFLEVLENALKREEFILHYQPIVKVENDAIVSVEALLYWQHPEFGLLSPGTFLSFCEKYGFIIPLGAWVLQKACQQLKIWQDQGHPDLSISINLSPRQLNDVKLFEKVSHAIHDNELSPSSVKLEITESFIIQNVESNIKLLKSLQNLGVQLSLDDFGTGYSSLNYLKRFPFSIIKIDKSFIADMTSNITSMAIVESIIALSKNLGLTLVAEGIESKDQLHMLRKMDCDMVQGYLYSKPISAGELTLLLKKSDALARKKKAKISTQVYQYKTLSQEHFDQAVKVIVHSFCQNEPMTRYLGITEQEFTPFAELMVKKAIRDSLSIVALDDQKVSACTIVEDIADPLDINIEIDPRFKIIFSLLEHLGSNFFQEKILEKGHMAHLFITAVSNNYHGQGLSRKVNFESIQLAKQKNFDFMCCEFTHHYNEQGTLKKIKNNKLLIRTCHYKNYVFEGKKPFKNLEGYASAYIWELREDARLRYKIKETELA